MARYHQMRVSDATIYRVLKRHGVSRLPGKVGCRKVQTKRYHKQVPGHHLQMDVKFLIFKSKAARKSNVINTPPSTMRRAYER